MVRPAGLVAFAALAVSLAVPPSATAQSRWPERPVKVVVPYAAGGNTDGIARITADVMRLV